MTNNPKQALIDSIITTYKQRKMNLLKNPGNDNNHDNQHTYNSLNPEQVEFLQKAGLHIFPKQNGVKILGIDDIIKKNYSPEDFTPEENAEIKKIRRKKFISIGVTVLGAGTIAAALGTIAFTNDLHNNAFLGTISSGIKYLNDLGGQALGMSAVLMAPLSSIISLPLSEHYSSRELYIKSEKTLRRVLEAIPYGNELSNSNSTRLFKEENLNNYSPPINEVKLDPTQKDDRSMIDFSIQSIQERLTVFTDKQEQIDHAESKTLKLN